MQFSTTKISIQCRHRTRILYGINSEVCWTWKSHSTHQQQTDKAKDGQTANVCPTTNIRSSPSLTFLNVVGVTFRSLL